MSEQTHPLRQVRAALDVQQCWLPNSRFNDVNLAETVFENVNLTGVGFDDVNLSSGRVTNANMTGFSIHGATLANASIAHCTLDGFTIDGIAVTELLACYRAAHPKGD